SGGFQLYLRFFNQFTVTYGTIGAVIILLLWLYLSGIAFLAGATISQSPPRRPPKIPHLWPLQNPPPERR
ncbi:MAG: YhjD/YihY/BrkB family envelope integrity protein, partial [Casimicrobiaceae bacterium]